MIASPTVFKLGGSYLRSPLLRSWLEAIAAHPPALIVPGGGLFADCIRSAQAELGFSHAAAHEMALMAMNQFARVLVDLFPSLKFADSFLSMERAFRASETCVLLAWPMLKAETELLPSWDLTSDSIAAWIARKLRAPLVLIKHTAIPPSSTAQRLAEAGIVDSAFPRFVEKLNTPVFVASPEDLRTAPARPKELWGQRLLAHAVV
jgi:aspartokinase-like uncharacterized kinase